MWKTGAGRIYRVKGWNHMFETQDPCLTAPEIVTFLDGQLPEARRVEIERHLDECRLCGAAVEGVAALEWREGFLRSAESILPRVRARTAALARSAAQRRVRRPPVTRYLALAATLVLGLGGAVYLARPGPGEALFQRYFEPYPSTQPIVRGVTPDGKSNALALYEARDYRGALAAFEVSLAREPDDAVVRFYAGLCRLALGRAPEAAVDLEQVSRLGPNELRAPADWYLALIHLRGRDLGEARSRLKHIAESGGFYQDKARALVSELDHLASGS